MEFEVLPASKAQTLRQAFIDTFVDTEQEHYQKYIATLKDYPDGRFYDGYLWDCLKDNRNWKGECSMEKAAALLDARKQIFVMWDLFSNHRVFTYKRLSLEYPKDTILQMPGPALARQVVEEWNTDWGSAAQTLWLPEDIYCFDESMSWYVIFTHEGWDQCSRPELEENDYIRICFHYP